VSVGTDRYQRLLECASFFQERRKVQSFQGRNVVDSKTNFALESIAQTFNGSVGFNRSVSATISRNGDLVSQCWLELTLKKSGDTFMAAESVIKEVELELGGQRVDRYNDTWQRIFDELFRNSDQEKAAYRDLVDFDAEDPVGAVKRFYVPLLFFFSRPNQPGLALPLIALQSITNG
jgi:hypothetical protein